MLERYELRAIFEVEDRAKLIAYARERHRQYYPRGTKDAPPAPRDVTAALADSLVDCKEGAAVEEIGLNYLASVTGPIRENEEEALDRLRLLYIRNGGRGPAWEALAKVLEVGPDSTERKRRAARETTER